MLEKPNLTSRVNGAASSASIRADMQAEAAVVLICPDEVCRRVLKGALQAQHAAVLSEFGVYPTYDRLLSVADMECDAFIVEVNSDADAALDTVEAICSRRPSATVMVYSTRNDPEIPDEQHARRRSRVPGGAR